jgi:mitogen-activated protein kinase kinase
MSSEGFKTKTMKRKNFQGLTLQKQPPKVAGPSGSDAQIPGAIGNTGGTADTLEIGVEFQLDLKTDELVVIKELGAGNGGTVSKVMHPATRVIMARKVSSFARVSGIRYSFLRSYMSKQKRPFENKSFENYTL